MPTDSSTLTVNLNWGLLINHRDSYIQRLFVYCCSVSFSVVGVTRPAHRLLSQCLVSIMYISRRNVGFLAMQAAVTSPYGLGHMVVFPDICSDDDRLRVMGRCLPRCLARRCILAYPLLSHRLTRPSPNCYISSHISQLSESILLHSRNSLIACDIE